MDQGAEGQATPPGAAQVRHLHAPVALRLTLAPRQQPTGSNVRLWKEREKRTEAGQTIKVFRVKGGKGNQNWVLITKYVLGGGPFQINLS